MKRWIPLTVLAVLLAGCGRGGSSAPGATNAGEAGSASAVAYSRCMRSNGVPTFPDPNSSGTLPKVSPQQLGVSLSRFQQAQGGCAHLLQTSDAQNQQTLSGMLDFARCMRSHGVGNWPDPTLDDPDQPVFDLRGQINPDTPRMDTLSGDCSYLLHPAPGQKGVFLCNGIGEPGCHHYG